MKTTALEYFNELIESHSSDSAIIEKYPKLRYLLERVCKDLTMNDSVQFSNLFSRLNYVCDKYNLPGRKKYQINTFRIHANNVLHSGYIPTAEEYLQDIKSISLAISHFYSITVPQSLRKIFPQTDQIQSFERNKDNLHQRIRVETISFDEYYIYVIDEDSPSETPIKVKHHVAGINEEFNSLIKCLWKGAQLNLIDVRIIEDNIYCPEFIVLEPDYLIDISSIAECFREEGNHPLNFIRGKLETIPNKHYLLLGNIANIFLDEFVNEKPESPVVYNASLISAFKQYPFEFSTCMDFPDDFGAKCQSHYQNIKEIIGKNFPSEGINRNDGVLEPAFICEKLGIQGRLDFMTQDFSRIVELKSGSAQTFGGSIQIKENNYIQTLLYYSVLNYNIKPDRNRKTYVLYSKHKELMWANKLSTLTKTAINHRNHIVINEKNIAADKTTKNAREIIESINEKTLITKTLSPNFLNNFILPQITKFKTTFLASSNLELDYFYSFYTFITREHYLSKAGDPDYESTSKGISSLWLSSLKEKLEAGEILIDLSVLENHSNSITPRISLSIPTHDQDFLPNFRQGDIIILYQRNSPKDNVTNRQVFKGSIEQINSEKITIRFRFKQSNLSVLPSTVKYAIEHDYLDSSFNTMYRGLFSFLQANQNRKDILLNTREATSKSNIQLIGNYNTNEIEINPIVLKAKQANDYFLIIGPPGTGKTSIVLKALVEEFYLETGTDILLLAYTNRAVDEICDSLCRISGAYPFIRIGSELSCDEKHRDKLLDKVIADCNTRNQVKLKILEHRIFVGTVASVSGKMELFRLKHFEVAIIDEASQILEPQLLGILSAKNADESNAIEKFILIGDHKQLPAVVIQSINDSKVEMQSLIDIGLTDRRNSLFERLIKLNKNSINSPLRDILVKQGRMHPDIALFPNYAFYNNKLQPIPLDHQVKEIDFIQYDHQRKIEKLLATKRVAFIPSKRNRADKTNKTNLYEAKIVAELLKNIFTLCHANSLSIVSSDSNQSNEISVGVITPFRSQIALIRKEIHKLGIADLEKITIDTIERYQGSQRDIIIYSFSVNQYYQLDFLANNIEEDGQIIDRKLNVAITRARKQLFITGNPRILTNNIVYYRLIEFIRSKDGFINCNPDDFLASNFDITAPNTEVNIPGNTFEPDLKFQDAFKELVTLPLQANSPEFPNKILGNDHDYNRLNLIEYGRTNFDQATIDHSSKDKVDLYCFYNMRKHYFSSYAIFSTYNDYLKFNFMNTGNRILFVDIGCGPLTAGLSFNRYFSSINPMHFFYLGVDISQAMLNKAQEFARCGIFSQDVTFKFIKSLQSASEDFWESVFSLSTSVIFNCSYLFGNLTKEDAESLADSINTIMEKYPLNKYILIFQNSSLEKRNRSYKLFKQMVPKLTSISMPKIETVSYHNTILSNFDKTETVFYEILSN